MSVEHPSTTPEPSKGEESITLLDLFRYSTRFELFLNSIGLVAAIGSGCATPFMSLIFGNLITSFVAIGRAGSDGTSDLADNFKRNASKDALQLVYLGIGMFSACFVFISIWSYTGESTTRRIRERYFRAVIHQDLSFYDDVTAGEVATRIELNAHLVQQGISEKLALIASYCSSFVTGLAIAYVKSWRLALVLSAIIPCILLVGAFITVAGTKHSKRSLEALSSAGGTAQESLSTVRTVYAFSAQKKLSDIYDAFISKACDHDMKFAQVVGVGMAIFSFIVYSSYSLSFYYGTTLLLQGRVSAGTVVTVGLSILVGSFSLAIVGPNVEALVHALEAARYLYSVIDRVPLIDSEKKDGRRLDNVVGQITFDDVSFSYSSRKDTPVLKKLSLSFPAAKTCALVGLSGSGKSTIVSLIERFYDVDNGAILLDAVDIRELNLKWLRSQIGLVSQDPILFSTTVYENVALGLLGTTYEGLPAKEILALVREACIKAHAHDFILGLPNGYDTQVGDGGMLLSGGQKQRIAIARAVVADPKILLLDEATSALDTQSEGIVQAALTQASQGRTTIVIAHRLSTVVDADLIYVMGGGSVLEQGTHDELMIENGSYAKLVHAQRLDHGNAAMEDVDEEGEEKDATGFLSVAQSSKGASRSTVNISSQTTIAPEQSVWSLIQQLAVLIPDTKYMYAWGSFFGILGGLVHPAFGIVYAKALHSFESSDLNAVRTAGNQNALWLFLIAIGSTLSLSLHNVLFGKAAVILVARLRTVSFQALLKKDVSFFDLDNNNPGTLTANLIGRPEKVKGFATMTLGAMLQCISCCIGGAVVGLIFGWKLGLVGIACMPPIVAMGFLRLQLVADKERDAKEAHNQSAQVASEAVVAIKTVASLTCEDYLCARYSRALHRPFKETILKTAFSNAIFAFSLAVILFAVALVFWYGSRLVASGEYTTFQFYVSFMSTVFGSWNAANVFLSVPDISSAMDAVREVLPLLNSCNEPAQAEKPPLEKPRTITGKVQIRDVSFRYPSRPEVRILNGFSVTVEPDTYVAFVGPSGSGKSTLIQLIERFYEPTKGQIYFDETALTSLPKNEYRSHIALVSQDTRLYSGTIKFNIALGSNRASGEVSEDEILRACRTANILEFIESLPMGFDTEVGERGSQLSGGQKQRIAIARALIRDPKLLLLDEATSALDANSEAVVQHALNKAADGRTTIAIAHRLSSIQHAHCIYFMQGGQIRESGTHSQLLSKRGAYYRFAQLQQLGNDRPARFSIDLFMKK